MTELGAMSPSELTRALAAEERSGQFSRAKAREKQRRFVRRSPAVWMVLPAVVIASVPALIVLSSSSRLFVAGAAVASGFWLTALFVLLGSGSAPQMMGDLAERWTVDQLRPLTKEGWRLVNHFTLKGDWDIDHVLVGPGGIVLIDTKWTGDDWAERSTSSGRLPDAASRLEEECARMRRWLAPVAPGIQVHAGIALWCPPQEFDLETPTMTIGRVTAMPGPDLAVWVRTLGSGSPVDQADLAWSRIASHAVRRDAKDTDRKGKPTGLPLKTIWTFGVTLLLLFLTILTALLAGATLIRACGWHPLLAPALVALILPGLLVARTRRGRVFGLAWTGGVILVGLLLAIGAFAAWLG